ncbi:MAG: tetratricopeptide repeat protein [Candidatus Gastranaerophilales bacterium]|nr:tetratricopeptide repeat protein [Candidatus Gastranaerophilales bacterium]
MEFDIAKEYCNIIKNKLALGEYDVALSNAKKLLLYSPDNAEGHYYEGLCNFALGNYEESVANYKKAIELDSNFAKAYYNLGVTKYYLNKFTEAVNNIEAACRIFHQNQDKPSYTKCMESIEFIKEEQGL